MNKLLVSCMAAAFALSVTAAEWFKGGSIADGFETKPSGGAWSEGLKFTEGDDVKIAVTEDAEVSFAVANDNAKSLDSDVVTVTSKLALSAYDEVPTFEEGEAPKAALAPVDDGTNPAYYGLVWEDGKAKFVALSGAEPKEDDVTVTIQMRKVLGQTQIKYAVDGTDLTDANGKAWLNTNVADAPTVVAYAGTGSVSTLAGDASGAEYLTAANPTISDAAGLAAVAKTAADFDGLAGQTVTLDKDIVLTGTVTPIGAGAMKDNVSFKMPGEKDAKITTQAEADALADAFKATAFKGTFDGAGHTISNVVLPRQDYTGLFGSTYGATIKNLKVACAGFASGTTDCGGAVIAGVTVDTTIQDCEVSGDVTATKAIAGISGYACSGTVIKDCVNKADLTTKNEKIGGMVGCAQNGATGMWGTKGVEIDGCTNEGNLTCTTSGKTFLGGLVTYADSTVTFKGDNVVKGTLTQTGGSVSSVAAPNSGTIVLDDGTTFQVPAAYKTTVKPGKAVDGLQLATVSEGVATLVKAADVTNGGSYKVMAAGATISLANVGDSITLDETLATATVTTSAASAKVTKSGNVYTVEADLATPGFTITVAENVTTTVTINGEEVDLTDVPETLTQNDTYTVTFAPVEDYMFAADAVTEYTGTVGTTDITITAPTALKIVAKIGDTPYASFDDAIAALKDGDKILVVDTDAKLPDDWKVDEEGYLIAKVYVAEVGGVKYESYADAKTKAEDAAVKIIADMTIEDDVGDVNIVIASGKTVTLKNLKTGPNGAANVAWKVAGEEGAEVKPTVVLTCVASYGFTSAAKFSDVKVTLGDEREVWIESPNYMDATVDLDLPSGSQAVVTQGLTIGSLTGEGRFVKRASTLTLTEASEFSGSFGSMKVALGDDATLTVPNATVPQFELGDKVLVTAAGEETTVYSVRDAALYYLNPEVFTAQGGSTVKECKMTDVTAANLFVDAEGTVITGITAGDKIVVKDTVDLAVTSALSGYKFVIDNNATVRFAMYNAMTYCADGLDVDVKEGSTVILGRKYSNGWAYQNVNTFNINDTRIHGAGTATVADAVTVELAGTSTIELPLVGTGTVNAFTGMTLDDDWAGTVVVSSFTEGMDLGAYGKAGSTVKLGADFNLDERKSYLSPHCTIAGDLDLGGHTLTLNNGYSQTETDDNAYVINRLVGEGAINSTWKGSTKQFVKINNVLADDGETIAFTGTLTGLEVVLPTGYELSADGHIVKKSVTPVVGPTIPEGEGTIVVDGTTAVITPAQGVTEVTISGGESLTAVTVPVGVTQVNGLPAAATVTVKAGETDITAAFTITNGAIALDETASVDGVPVTPVLDEKAKDGALVVGDNVAVAVKTIPGLTYTLQRSATVKGETTDVASVKATAKTLTLTDPMEGGKPTSAFYTIRVEAK